jgi:DNA-binding PadR family transcriptional regulator
MSTTEIRLTGTSYAVLSLLAALGQATPYELKQVLERSIQNFWPVPHTTFYAEPERLRTAGLLSVEQETTGRRRKVYRLTDEGREALDRWAATPQIAPPQVREEGVLKIFAGADPIPIMRSRRDWHRAKLAELEGYLEFVDAERPRGVGVSLRVGIAYERGMLEATERFLADQAATGNS